MGRNCIQRKMEKNQKRKVKPEDGSGEWKGEARYLYDKNAGSQENRIRRKRKGGKKPDRVGNGKRQNYHR